MIKIVNTENLTGVTISGTYDDIYEIYEAIEKVIGPETESLTTLRILGVCYDLRHCFMGNREIDFVENNFHVELQKYHEIIHPDTNVHFCVNILWLEVMFAVLALDDFVKRYGDDKTFNKMMKSAGITDEQMQYYNLTRFEDIALVRIFQEKVWRAFRDACGDAAFKRLYKKAKLEKYNYIVTCNYVNFCTHYLDILEMEYINSKPEKREKLLATLVRKIIVQGDDYYQIYQDVSSYAIENNISRDQVRLSHVEYPDDVEW